MHWRLSHRADVRALPIADRHYNRQKVGSPQFVPPGRCIVLLSKDADALWTSSWPFAEFVKHAWAGAWINTMFRNEGSTLSSDLILEAIAITRSVWSDTPALGMVTFIDPKKVKPTIRRGQAIYGYCYMKAGFKHVGFTKGGLWVWQLLPDEMPEPQMAIGSQMSLMIA
jgi:hypothetical protein